MNRQSLAERFLDRYHLERGWAFCEKHGVKWQRVSPAWEHQKASPVEVEALRQFAIDFEKFPGFVPDRDWTANQLNARIEQKLRLIETPEPRLKHEGPKAERAECLKKLGGVCVGILPEGKKCGVKDVSVLQIDHIFGGGTQHRLQVGQAGFYADVMEHGTERYQLLCASCNARKIVTHRERG